MSAQTISSYSTNEIAGRPRRSVWAWLTQPSAAITEAEQRRRARLLSALLLAMIASLTTGIVVVMLSGSYNIAITQFAALGVVLVAYGLSRTRHMTLAATLTTAALSSPSFLIVAMGQVTGSAAISAALNWLVLPVVLGSLWFSVSGTVLMSALEIGGILLMLVIAPEVAMRDLIGPLGFVGTVCALSLITAGLRTSDQKQIRQQLTELNDLNVALKNSVEEAQAATAMAREANRLKSQFLATMSHELRTPLNAIIGFAEIMIAGMGGTIDADAQHMIERMHANSQRLLGLINDVLDLSKIQAQRVEMVRKPFSPRKLAETMHSSLSSLAAKKGLQFTMEVDTSLPDPLFGDETLLTRIGTNLLSNAIKFTDSGSVHLAFNTIGNGKWAMSVKDTGIGIPPHALTYIFDPFRQVDGTSQRAFGGSGLGLAITRELVRAMDGHIHVSSTVGEGSTFVVELPIVLPQSTESEEGGTHG